MRPVRDHKFFTKVETAALIATFQAKDQNSSFLEPWTGIEVHGSIGDLIMFCEGNPKHRDGEQSDINVAGCDLEDRALLFSVYIHNVCKYAQKRSFEALVHIFFMFQIHCSALLWKIRRATT